MKDSIEKIRTVVERRGLTNFWEAFQYMLDAGYPEFEALKIGLELFNGNPWENVISRQSMTPMSTIITYYSGSTISISNDIPRNWVAGIDVAEPDDLLIDVTFMTKEANPNYLPIYTAYLTTRKYNEIPELELHLKTIKLKLTTELAIAFFKSGCNKTN